MRRAVAPVVVAFALLGGCGSEGPDITPGAASSLQQAVRDLRAAVEQGDRSGATDRLVSLRTTVVNLVTTGGVTPERATKIYAAIEGVQAQLGAATVPSSTTVPVSSTTGRPVATGTSTSTTSSTTTSTVAADPPGRGRGRNKG